MNNKIYLSTGALVERRNGYNFHIVSDLVPRLMDEGFVSGAEFMMIKLYYEKRAEVVSEFLSAGVKFPVIHSDKDIGAYLSEAGVILSEGGDKAEAEKKKREALDMLRFSLETGGMVGAERLVLHLWGGLCSDKAVDYNAEWLAELIEIARPYGIKILIENVPSSATDPLTNWKKLEGYLDEVGLIFDTRFATCHRQPRETLTAPVAKKIEHVHVSDYRGGLKEFSCLRPVWHPGEGIADFDLMFGLLKELDYKGTFTLESPGIISGSEIDEDRIRKSLAFIRENFG
ncbi:MAG: sugar phosphate isomerase/epimerase [Ruminococcaceae bacterium]|nr:sugar phosphate isomerase/epimerase [Oscillospiraceae bacterium]